MNTNSILKPIKLIRNLILGSTVKVKPEINLSHDRKALYEGPKIVAIGGGTGLSTMLRGLKAYTSNITAVVTVADDGGGSGVLRQDLGILPPGDIRNCILALANTEPVMQQLLQYRFKEGILKGQSFGNLFLAAMNGISSSFEEAVQRMSEVLAVTGRVLPVSLEDINLCAELDDGYLIEGESNIGHHNSFHKGRIKRVFIKPEYAKPLEDVINSINEADAVVLGPGSLYTSIIPNLLVDGICDAIKKSRAVKIYVCNIMTQPGETDGYMVNDHLNALFSHSMPGLVDYCIVNNAPISRQLERKYLQDGAEQVKDYGIEAFIPKIKIVKGDFVCVIKGLIRHDALKLAEAVINVVAEDAFLKKRKGIIDCYSTKDRLDTSM
jgi:uncharacterized cofD-like protein